MEVTPAWGGGGGGGCGCAGGGRHAGCRGLRLCGPGVHVRVVTARA